VSQQANGGFFGQTSVLDDLAAFDLHHVDARTFCALFLPGGPLLDEGDVGPLMPFTLTFHSAFWIAAGSALPAALIASTMVFDASSRGSPRSGAQPDICAGPFGDELLRELGVLHRFWNQGVKKTRCSEPFAASPACWMSWSGEWSRRW